MRKNTYLVTVSQTVRALSAEEAVKQVADELPARTLAASILKVWKLRGNTITGGPVSYVANPNTGLIEDAGPGWASEPGQDD